MKSLPLFIILLSSGPLYSQVPVREEPRHRPVFQNKYIRLLDVWIRPGDTTLFHIHETPSLFTHFTSTKVSIQEVGKQWTSGYNRAGNASFNDFASKMIHRVTNVDTGIFHVMDIEILRPFDTNYRHRPMPYKIIFENRTAVAYEVDEKNMTQEITRSRRPSVAQLIKGENVLFHDQVAVNSREFKQGEFIYIETGSSFYFSSTEGRPVQMIIFEIK